MSDLLAKLAAEAHRIEEDTEHSAKGHFNAAERWGRYHLAVGLPSAVLAAIAGGTAFGDLPEVAGSLAILSTALTTVLTFLKPSEHAENHKAVAGQYLALRNQTRLFRELDLAETEELSLARKRLIELASARDDLNQASPSIARRDYEKAKRDIDEGRSQYRVDKEAA
ncbi:SLATT domain-containing protein [Alloalcanivorax xenomutans]|uniref:SLATT domain-containing protein n=1 Tax=Alloalcanivorax xenomutans TaxID=1094342 RepID=UPI00292E6E07|nr:SLATT domain-containing protein [Alloalcanivorax xenomutans]WOA30906.1 SLATT domain-containing protein [Alloalcanivorax xenomutans]